MLRWPGPDVQWLPSILLRPGDSFDFQECAEENVEHEGPLASKCKFYRGGIGGRRRLGGRRMREVQEERMWSSGKFCWWRSRDRLERAFLHEELRDTASAWTCCGSTCGSIDRSHCIACGSTPSHLRYASACSKKTRRRLACIYNRLFGKDCQTRWTVSALSTG